MPPRPSKLVSSHIPEDLERLIFRCLAKSPEDRPSSAKALYAELEQLECHGTWTAEEATDYVDSVLPPSSEQHTPIVDTLREVEARM
jgi:hypothetical protein